MQTYKEAREEYLNYFGQLGLHVKRVNPQGQPLKTVHATTKDGKIRFWFRPQAVWYSVGTEHSHVIGHARSTWLDIRTMTPAQFLGRMFGTTEIRRLYNQTIPGE